MFTARVFNRWTLKHLEEQPHWPSSLKSPPLKKFVIVCPLSIKWYEILMIIGCLESHGIESRVSTDNLRPFNKWLLRILRCTISAKDDNYSCLITSGNFDALNDPTVIPCKVMLTADSIRPKCTVIWNENLHNFNSLIYEITPIAASILGRNDLVSELTDSFSDLKSPIEKLSMKDTNFMPGLQNIEMIENQKHLLDQLRVYQMMLEECGLSDKSVEKMIHSSAFSFVFELFFLWMAALLSFCFVTIPVLFYWMPVLFISLFCNWPRRDVWHMNAICISMVLYIGFIFIVTFPVAFISVPLTFIWIYFSLVWIENFCGLLENSIHCLRMIGVRRKDFLKLAIFRNSLQKQLLKFLQTNHVQEFK